MATLEFAHGTQRRYETSWPSAVFQLYNKIDFSRNNGGSGDTVQCLLVPAGTVVTNVVHIVGTPEGGTSTGNIGDGDDPDGWIASVDNNASAGTASLSNASGSLTGASSVLTSIAGGAAGDHTVTGITTSDVLTGVIHLSETTDTLDTVDDLTSEFSITGADTINNDGGTNTTGGFLLVSYREAASLADANAIGGAGGKYYSSEDTIDMLLSANAVDTAVIEMVAMCMTVGY